MEREKQIRSIRAGLRRYFVAGILVLLPLAVTVWIVWQIIGTVEGGVQMLIEKLNVMLASRTSADGQRINRRCRWII